MDVAMITAQYLSGEKESFDVSNPEVDVIKIIGDKILISFNKDPDSHRNRCKVIITDNLSSYEISPCDLESLVASSGKK